MTVKQAVKYLEAAEANEGEEAIPDYEFVLFEKLGLIDWNGKTNTHILTDNGRQWLKQLTNE